jgi:phosphatidylglycerol:prolipoprotein diacylglycerol transferase
MTSVVYSSIMISAILCGAWLLRRFQQPLALPPKHRIAIGLSAFCGAMLGAKLPFLLTDLEGFLDGTAWFSNGKTILCGMVGAYAGVELAKWTLSIRTKTGDSFVVPAAVTIAVGRLACFSAGCCYGVPTDLPWGMRCSAIDDLPRHPTQIYESLFHLLMAGILVYLLHKQIWKGQLAKFYILSYFAYRFLTEFIRPEVRYEMYLTGYQWLILLLAPVFVFLWWIDAQQLKRRELAAS